MPISAPPPSWASIKNKPTTMSGFGITDEKCKAWVNFNGTGTVAIRSSFNVSSITDNGVGNYTVNMANALQDANYATVINMTDGGGNNRMQAMPYNGSIYTANAVQFQAIYDVSSYDSQRLCVSIFR